MSPWNTAMAGQNLLSAFCCTVSLECQYKVQSEHRPPPCRDNRSCPTLCARSTDFVTVFARFFRASLTGDPTFSPQPMEGKKRRKKKKTEIYQTLKLIAVPAGASLQAVHSAKKKKKSYCLSFNIVRIEKCRSVCDLRLSGPRL